MLGKLLLGFARARQQETRVLGVERGGMRLLDNPAEHALIEIVTAKSGIAVGRQHLEHAAREPEDGNVERAAAEIVHGVDALRRIVEAVGDGCRRGFVQQAQHVEAGEFSGILGRLALRVIEIGRHGDDGADQFAAEGALGTVAQRLEDVGRHFDRALAAGHRNQLHHARRIDELVGIAPGVAEIGQPAAHETLCRNDGVVRILALPCLGIVAGFGPAIGMVANHRRQQRAAALVIQHPREAGLHRGHQRVGGAKIDADSQPVLVRRGGHAGFGNLQQGHIRRFLSRLVHRRSPRSACA